MRIPAVVLAVRVVEGELIENMSKTIRHKLNLSKRSIEIVIVEHNDKIVVDLIASKIGDFGDISEIERAMLPLIEPYDSDPRPISWRNPNSGEVATVHGNSESCTVLIQTQGNLN